MPSASQSVFLGGAKRGQQVAESSFHVINQKGQLSHQDVYRQHG
jgi:hypothetical protein